MGIPTQTSPDPKRPAACTESQDVSCAHRASDDDHRASRPSSRRSEDRQSARQSVEELATDETISAFYSVQLWPFISCKWFFLWDYTFYKWGYKYL